MIESIKCVLHFHRISLKLKTQITTFLSNMFVFSLKNLFADKKSISRMHKSSRRLRRNRDAIHINGYRFVIASQSDTTIYLKCANFRNKCFARASKRKDTGETFITKANHAETCVFSSILSPDYICIKNDPDHMNLN